MMRERVKGYVRAVPHHPSKRQRVAGYTREEPGKRRR